MFEVVTYDILTEGDTDIIKIWVKNLTDEEITVDIHFSDSVFQVYNRFTHIKFLPQTTHWFFWELVQKWPSDEDRGMQMGLLCGGILKFFLDKKIVFESPINYIRTNLKLRNGLNSSSTFNKNKFWIIGDSHVGYSTNVSTDLLQTKKYDIIPAGLIALSLSRFLNSDWKKWLLTIPIFKDDIVSFELGEIDLRMSLFQKSIKYNKDVKELLSDLIDRYCAFIIDFRKTYPNKLVILPPNRPIKDDGLGANKKYFGLDLSNINQRVELWEIFNTSISNFCNLHNILYWDYKSIYKDDDGSLKNDVLIVNDIHFKIKEPMIFNLKSKIENEL